MPVNFQNDHYDFLLAQEEMFARKLSPQAHELKNRLVTLFDEAPSEIPLGANGKEYFHYLRLRGREGKRFTRRIWEREGEIGRENTLVVIACKKWHIAKSYAYALQNIAAIQAYGYVFNEDDAGMPYLGGLGNSLTKRARHRRSFLRSLFRTSNTNQLVMCIDPVSIDTLEDLCTDNCTVKLMEIGCDFDDEYLAGHAQRMGLAIDTLSAEMRHDLLRTLRSNIHDESNALHALGFQVFERVQETSSAEEITAALQRLTYIDQDTANEVAAQVKSEY